MAPASPENTHALPSDVLLVEDDLLIALDFEETILRLGAKTVRTASSVAKALDMIAGHPPDFAFLNINLGSETSYAIAERLDALGIPFAFVTGYGADAAIPKRFARIPRLNKPCSTDVIEAAMRDRSG